MLKVLRLQVKREASSPMKLILVTYSKHSSRTPIEIPARIQRGPTDILQTLSNTVKRDPTAAHYKYHDDPFLIPLSTVGKRTFALAQEAGRKAAKWIVNENSKLFNHSVADPSIEVFKPDIVYNEKSNVGEDTLLKVISDGHVGDALVIYELLQNKNISVSENVKQALLELVCFYNCEDGVSEELFEERWFGSIQKGKVDAAPKTWKDNGFAESLFKTMSPTPAAYSALLQGFAKYGQLDKAWNTFQTARENGIELDVGAFNAMISIVNGIKQGSELRWQLVQDLLSNMAVIKVQPNISTLNAVLHVVASMGGVKNAENIVNVLAEFRKLGVEPSLGSYYYVLHGLMRDRSASHNIGAVLSEILDAINKTPLTIRHHSDTSFFVKAMEACRNYTQDVELARRVDDLLHVADNYNLIGDSLEESTYYRHMFMLLCTTETIDVVMESYNRLVPHIYTPEPSVMQELLRAVDNSGESSLLPRLWSDMVLFDHADREHVVGQLLGCLVHNEPAPGSQLVAAFADVATQIWEKIENQPANRTNVMSWTGEMLSNVMLLLCRSDNLEAAARVMDKLTKEDTYVGEPNMDALSSYMNLCIKSNDFSKAWLCLKYCKETEKPEVITMTKDLQNRLTLADEQALMIAELLNDQQP